MKIISATPAAVAAAVLLLGGTVVPAQAASATGIYKNCTQLRTKYPHGVGRSNARDQTSGKPVTSFTHSTSAYNTAIKANAGLDRDKDGIACEQA